MFPYIPSGLQATTCTPQPEENSPGQLASTTSPRPQALQCLPTKKDLQDKSAAAVVPAVRLHAVAGHPDLHHIFGGVSEQPAPPQLYIQERHASVCSGVVTIKYAK